MSDVALGRRAMLQSLLGVLGAGTALPFLADGHPMQHHLLDAVGVDAAEAQAADTGYAPQFLDRHQLETLEVLAERVIPGSTTARVAPFLDSLLAVSAAESQRRLVGSIGAFELLAIDRHGKPWKALTPAQHDALLTHASTSSPSEPIRGFFDDLRGWISGAYYSSEIGMRELGWTGNVFHNSFPGCQHPGGHP